MGALHSLHCSKEQACVSCPISGLTEKGVSGINPAMKRASIAISAMICGQ
jgi:hypothetical protein